MSEIPMWPDECQWCGTPGLCHCADAHLAGIAQGRAEERERIVTDLRKNNPNAVYSSDSRTKERVTYADRYERGDHWSEDRG